MKKRKMKNHKKINTNTNTNEVRFEDIYNKIKSNRVENYNWNVYACKSLEDELYKSIRNIGRMC